MEEESNESSSEYETPPEEMEEEEEEDSDDGEGEGESDEEDVQEQTTLRRELKDKTFEELEALKQKMGLKEFNEAMFGSQKKKGKEPEKPDPKGKPKTGEKLKKKKKGIKKKDRPMEVSSKARVSKLRQVVDVPRRSKRDPRFDKSCGEYSDQFFNTEYSFLRDLQKKEADDCKSKLKTVDDKSQQKEMKKFIQRVNDKEKARAAKERLLEKQKLEKVENRKRVAEGKQPYYMKESTKKLVELAEKYDELKASGGLDKYLKKKRKRNAVRDRKSLK